MTDFIEIIGWTASILFSICGLPQAYQSVKSGNSHGISSMFLYLWLAGEILMQVYVIYKHSLDMPLLVNYWINTFFVLIILYYKIRPRKIKLFKVT